MTQLILIRHGETVWNTERRLQGQSDSPLTERGLWQARQLGERMRAESFSALYSSDLPRALRTAEHIAVETGHRIVTDARLRERHFGIFEGLTRAEMERCDPVAQVRFLERAPDYAVPEGESPAGFMARVRAALEDIAERHANETIAIVTHGLVLDCAYRAATGLPLQELRGAPLVNASLNRFFVDRDGWQMGIWGDAAHLGDGVTIFGDGSV
jgi:probable phosphoglycerate mutase